MVDFSVLGIYPIPTESKCFYSYLSCHFYLKRKPSVQDAVRDRFWGYPRAVLRTFLRLQLFSTVPQGVVIPQP